MLINKNTSPKKTLTVTSAPFDYNALDPYVQIPLSDTTKYGRTLEATDFPTFSFLPESVVYIERCCVSGRNTSGENVTINYQMYKDGNPVSGGGGSVSVETAKTYHADCSFYGVSVGDLCEVSVWGGSNTDVNVECWMSHVAPTRILPTTKPVCQVSETYTIETPTTGVGNVQYSRGYIGVSEYAMPSTPYTLTSGFRSFNDPTNGYNAFRYGNGDYQRNNVGTITNHSSNIPYFYISHIPTTITYREILL